ncbi:hypothetical protein EYF80_012750 [Liparis tanakae]|uniref:Uncharacterized protein n=1 Tax=Liparis tanakae TaxID=230148 RepID=A0A4Z2IIH5_9TELE|nr:hypothetical protein EYF80_012750 [Liparis tanakae]
MGQLGSLLCCEEMQQEPADPVWCFGMQRLRRKMKEKRVESCRRSSLQMVYPAGSKLSDAPVDRTSSRST